MAVYDGKSLARQEPGSRVAQSFIYVSMMLAALAVGMGVYNHAGLPAPAAVVAAIAVLVLLYVVHTLLARQGMAAGTQAGPGRRYAEPRRRMPEAPREQQKPVAAPQPPFAPAAAQPRTNDQRPADPRPSAVLPLSPAPAAGGRAEPALPGPTLPGTGTAPAGSVLSGPVLPGVASILSEPARHAPSTPRAAPSVVPGTRPSGLQPFAYTTPPPKPAIASAPASAAELPAASAGLDLMQDYWSYRPTAPHAETPPPAAENPVTERMAEALRSPQTATRSEPPVAAPAPGAESGPPREADVEMVQEAIKRLLEQVNAADVLKAAAASAPAGAPAPGRASVAPAARPMERPMPAPPVTPAPASTDRAVESSLDALRLAAETMRAASRSSETAARQPQPHRQPPAGRAAPPPRTEAPATAAPLMLGPLRDRATAIADAITAGRIDVLLEPILGLEDQRTRHYEISLRLRDAAGRPLDDPSRDLQLRGTGLLPLFDCARVARTSAIAGRLEARGKSGSVFSDFNRESLTDDRFLGELAETLHQRASFAAQLVLTFTQSEVRGFAGGEWDTVADMRGLGFRFALSEVTDLDMDFEALAEAGFVFIKLDADVFLNGLPIGGGRIPPTDLCRHLAKLGLTLIVGRIDSEEKRARIFGFGVLLGQGQLFGGPRPVKASALSGQGNAAA